MGQKEYLGSRTGEVEGGKPILALLCTGADTSQTARPRATGAPSHSELLLTMPSSSSRGQQGACLPQKVMGTWCHLPSLMGVCRWLLLPSPLEAWLTGPWPSGTGRVTLPVTEGTLSPLYPIILLPRPLPLGQLTIPCGPGAAKVAALRRDLVISLSQVV